MTGVISLQYLGDTLISTPYLSKLHRQQIALYYEGLTWARPSPELYSLLIKPDYADFSDRY